MMLRSSGPLALAAALLAAPSAQAADPRVQHVAFHENQVVSIAARPGYEATIAFADGEQVENIAVGSSAMWQITPNRRADRLFIKPTSARAVPTNMTVITDRHTYLFALRVGLGGEPLFLMRFAYPDDPPPQPPATPPEALTSAAAEPAPLAALDPATLHFGWTMRGARGLLPDRVFDDGHAVYLAWPKGRDLPAVLAPAPGSTEAERAKIRAKANGKNPDKGDGPVNYSSQGDYLVVDGLHSALILRAGKEIAWLERDTPMAQGPETPLPAAPVAAAPVSGGQ